MEPIELSVAAIATLALSKFLDKTTEKVADNLGENVVDQGGKLWGLLKRKSPKAVAALKPAEDKPLDLGQAVLEVEAAVKADPEIAEAVEEVAKTAETNSNIASEVQSLKKAIESLGPTFQNSAQLAEKINGVFQGNTITNPRNVAGIVLENKTEKGDIVNNF